jgi:hypothetical protein
VLHVKKHAFLLPKVRKRPRRQKPNDDAFRAWIQTLPSCLSGCFSETVNGEGRNLACHVRRAGESGTGYKALFSCVPMTDEEHRYQHQYGELSCLLYFGVPLYQHPDRDEVANAKHWFEERAKKYRDEWFRMQGDP